MEDTVNAEKRKQLLEKMSAEAERELREIAHPSAKAKIKKLAKRALGKKISPEDLLFWPAGLLLLGLFEAGHFAEAERYLDLWFERGMPVANPDDALSGAVMLRLLEATGKKRYQDAADRIFDYLESCRKDAEGSIVYGQRSSNDWIYADGAGQTCLFFAEYARVMGGLKEQGQKRDSEGSGETADREEAGRNPDEEKRTCRVKIAEDEALRQAENFLSHGMDFRSGLPYHGYDEKSGMKYGIIGWGRAAGWLLLGLSELDFAEKEYAGKAEKMILAVLDRIRADGLFSWQLDCIEGPLDTSASGMIFYSLLRMERCRKEEGTKQRQPQPEERGACKERESVCAADETIHARIGAACEKAGELLFAMAGPDGKIGQASAECVDFAEYRQKYGNYPWGQGAVLAFLAALHKTGSLSGKGQDDYCRN